MKQLDKILKITIVFAAFVLINGCATNLDKVTPTSSELVEINAKIAIEACGQGNVKKVSVEGYECKLN